MRIGRREKRKQWIAGAFGVCAAVVADQLTKELAYRNLKLSGKGFVRLLSAWLPLSAISEFRTAEDTWHSGSAWQV